MTALLSGLTLAAAIGAAAWGLSGADAARGAVVAGMFATGVHLLALAFLRPALVPPFGQLAGRWAMGLALRLAAVSVLAGALYGRPEWFPALPTAAGFLGVLIPLLFAEMRMLWRTLQAGE